MLSRSPLLCATGRLVVAMIFVTGSAAFAQTQDPAWQSPYSAQSVGAPPHSAQQQYSAQQYSAQQYANDPAYAPPPEARSPYSPPPGAGQQNYAQPGYGGAPPQGYGYNGGNGGDPASGNDAYSPSANGYPPVGDDAYRPPQSYGSGAYSANGYGQNDAYAPRGGDGGYGSTIPSQRTYSDPGEPVGGGVDQGYGAPYSPPPASSYGDPEPPSAQSGGAGTFDQNEIITAGHGFFGAVSKNLASAIEYAFKSQGRPNGYILGEDAGGAFVVGLRYGEGRLVTKDAGEHKVYWQGPSVGYDAGAEGSKTMVLVYNLRDPGDIYNRFGGVQGSAYFVGGVSVQFQKYNDVTLGIIRSGVGVRLGANIGYLNYTRSPTWNPL